MAAMSGSAAITVASESGASRPATDAARPAPGNGVWDEATANWTENGIDPNLVTLCVTDKRETTQKLVTHPAVKSVDFTGGNVFRSCCMASIPEIPGR